MLTDYSIYVAYMMQKMMNNNQESHYSFKKELSYELVMPLVHRRAQIRGLRSSVKEAMKLVGIEIIIPQVQERRLGGASRCTFCPRDRDRKSKTACRTCAKYICAQHQIVVCSECQ